ncbi:hypothetical protein K450DRAFT_236587 [Umbelopsis ramanniana AG]|uniref:Uncharacterized protein n=1 Tax=Umbelopsis ramanniana AG TaxID=1314678 RepID=A0AAD5EBY5_UMBRA|nr:uncharacterized protein K450DRAFT_236587 [Umbelopsis ramanniana AG]KAI8580644.1 hypothetical protein K450DRAFT_236587 [Umbelopsis ramanniana AG]
MSHLLSSFLYDSLSFCFILLFGFDVILFPLFKYLWTTSSFYMFWMPDHLTLAVSLLATPSILWDFLIKPTSEANRRYLTFSLPPSFSSA